MNGNPLIKTDYPDPDVIRVGDAYYMVSTTMHFMPGCVILRSYNLIDWEILTYVYETLECTDEACLKNEKNARCTLSDLEYDDTPENHGK